MRETDRIAALIARVEATSFASVRDLAEVLGVSAATVRRDIDKLDAEGVLRKVYGGVSVGGGAESRLPSPSHRQNEEVEVAEKRAIARAAEGLVRDGDTILLNGGSTCFALGQRLARRPLDIHTNSMPLAAWLAEQGVGALSLAGGRLHRESGLLFDPEARPPYATRLFTGTQGIGPEGLLESHPMLVAINRSLSEAADEVVVLAASSKFGQRARHVVLPLARVHCVVTDWKVKDRDARMLEAEGIRLIVAEEEAA